MHIDDHDKILDVGHNSMGEHAKLNGIKIRRMSQDEVNKDIIVMKEELSLMKMLLHESERGHIYGWSMKQWVTWPIKELFHHGKSFNTSFKFNELM